LKFVRNTVQTAYHGAKGIQYTPLIAVQGAPKTRGASLRLRFCRFPADFTGQGLHLTLSLEIQLFKPCTNVKIFQICVMMKTGPATILQAPVTLKAIVIDRPGIRPVHGGKNTLQPPEEIG
jgi:hypothetical protein